MNKRNGIEAKQRRQDTADAHVTLSPREQLAKLDTLLGKGKGAKKERAKLAKKIEAS